MARAVTTWEEADVAIALGATPAEAAAVVEALVDAGLLPHGVAVVAAAAAARWGIGTDDALRALAGGRALREAFSDYELRFGREEAEQDLETAWERREGAAAEAWDRLRTHDGTERGEPPAPGLVHRSAEPSPSWLDPRRAIPG